MSKPRADIILPAYNEEECIEDSVSKSYNFCKNHLQDYDWKIIVADNNSNDNTLKLAKELSKKYDRVTYNYIDKKGRGRSLVKVWGESDADICAYMDIDLSTDLKHVPEMLDAIYKKGYDLAVGSRNLPESDVIDRGLKRTIISKGYILVLKLLTWTDISDAQCGFKAISKKAKDKLLKVMNPDNWRGSAWFFDTELLIIAKKAGYKVIDIPVKWIDDPGSTVHIVQDAIEDLRGIWRLLRTRPWKKLKRD